MQACLQYLATHEPENMVSHTRRPVLIQPCNPRISNHSVHVQFSAAFAQKDVGGVSSNSFL
jgi:hypothetical protein